MQKDLLAIKSRQDLIKSVLTAWSKLIKHIRQFCTSIHRRICSVITQKDLWQNTETLGEHFCSKNVVYDVRILSCEKRIVRSCCHFYDTLLANRCSRVSQKLHNFVIVHQFQTMRIVTKVPSHNDSNQTSKIIGKWAGEIKTACVWAILGTGNKLPKCMPHDCVGDTEHRISSVKMIGK